MLSPTAISSLDRPGRRSTPGFPNFLQLLGQRSRLRLNPFSEWRQPLPLFDFSKRKPTIEEQLETLIRVGISPNEYFSLDDAVEAFGRQAYDRKPYLLLLCVL